MEMNDPDKIREIAEQMEAAADLSDEDRTAAFERLIGDLTPSDLTELRAFIEQRQARLVEHAEANDADLDLMKRASETDPVDAAADGLMTLLDIRREAMHRKPLRYSIALLVRDDPIVAENALLAAAIEHPVDDLADDLQALRKELDARPWVLRDLTDEDLTEE